MRAAVAERKAQSFTAPKRAQFATLQSAAVTTHSMPASTAHVGAAKNPAPSLPTLTPAPKPALRFYHNVIAEAAFGLLNRALQALKEKSRQSPMPFVLPQTSIRVSTNSTAAGDSNPKSLLASAKPVSGSASGSGGIVAVAVSPALTVLFFECDDRLNEKGSEILRALQAISGKLLLCLLSVIEVVVRFSLSCARASCRTSSARSQTDRYLYLAQTPNRIQSPGTYLFHLRSSLSCVVIYLCVCCAASIGIHDWFE
jgi:hypothetical protein